MAQYRLDFLAGQAVDVGRVVVETLRVGRSGPTPVFPLHQRQLQYQGTQERPVQDQPGAGLRQSGLRVARRRHQS